MASWILTVLILSSLTVFVVGNEDPGVTVTCGNHEIQVSFYKGSFPSLDASHMHLSDPSCRATETPSHVLISTPLNGCGTSFVETEDTFVFSNVVYDYAEPINNVITREDAFELPFKCNYSRKNIPSLDFLSERRTLPPIERLGNLTFRFEVYRSSSYATPHTTYPVRVTLNEYMYLWYSVESSADLVVMALNCKATKDSDFYSSPQHTIILDGCPKDTTLVDSYDPSSSSQTFKLKAFRFFNDYDLFYLHCELLACHRGSENSRCRQGCLPAEVWMKRQLKEFVSTTGPYAIKRGPIIFQEAVQNESEDLGNQPAAAVGSTAATDGFGLIAVLAVAVLFVTYCIARLLFSKDRVGDLYITQDDQMSRTHARSIPPIFTGGLHWTATSGPHERRRRQFVDRSGGIQRLPNWKIKLEGGPMQS